MALICDTSGIYGLYDSDDAHHEATVLLVEAETGPLLLPVILLAEIHYLPNRRLGHDAAFAASRQRRREVAGRLGVRRLPNLGGCPAT